MKYDIVPRSVLMLSFLLLILNIRSHAQATTSNISTVGSDTTTQLAVPGGAGATVTGSGTAGAGPLLGFQLWAKDEFLVSTFFSLSAPQAISGVQHDFGAFMLNPPGQGTSYSFAGSRVFPCFPFVHCAKDKASDFVGVAGRAGITNSSWQNGSGNTSQSVSGTVAYLTPAILVTSKTYTPLVGDSDEHNEYQFGVSAGPSFRLIGGDLAQNSNNVFRQQTLGVTKKSYTGVEFELFVRLNSFRPFVRVSRFNIPNGVDIAGFSGIQAVFGVDVLSAIFKKSL